MSKHDGDIARLPHQRMRDTASVLLADRDVAVFFLRPDGGEVMIESSDLVFSIEANGDASVAELGIWNGATPEKSKCFLCSEPIHRVESEIGWIHDHGGEKCNPAKPESETKQ